MLLEDGKRDNKLYVANNSFENEWSKETIFSVRFSRPSIIARPK